MKSLWVQEPGVSLGKTSECLVVRKSGQVLHEYPFFTLDHIMVAGKGISLSSDLVGECLARGIQLTFCQWNATPMGKGRRISDLRFQISEGRDRNLLR
jgi:CRISPR-associated protein Cas1